MTEATANQGPIFQVEPRPEGVLITAADTTVAVTAYTAGADGALIDSIAVHSLDSTARSIELLWNNGVTDFVLGTVEVPLSSGTTDAIPTFNLLDPFKLVLQVGGGLTLPAGGILKLRAVVTVASNITFTVNGGDY